MYAIIQSGGKQFRVEKGTKLHVELLEKEIGSEFEIPEILLVSGENGPKIGQPFVKDSKVLASVVRHMKGPKVIIFKKRSKKGYKKKTGHRQNFTEIEIKEVI